MRQVQGMLQCTVEPSSGFADHVLLRSSFMISSFKMSGAVLAVAVVALSSPALAQQAPAPGAAIEQSAPAPARAARAAKKKVAAKNATEIVIVNGRTAVVTGVSVTSTTGKAAATLKKPLEPGKKIALKLAKGAGCTFAINASFSDDAEFDQSEVNLCLDKTVRFTE